MRYLKLYRSSSGSLGFKGSCCSINYVAQVAAENAVRTAIQLGIKSVEVEIKGLGYGKESSLRGLRLGVLLLPKLER
jgi:small subunit ribosomal protein S11